MLEKSPKSVFLSKSRDNCGDIEWSHMQVPQGVQKRQSQQQLLDIIGEHCLTQVVNIPMRNDKTVDLL